MAPFCEINVEDIEPMSRTYQYRKVMKPLLERKRRARINKCLDHLKDLMVGALPKDCESITKLEKADVLELTVDHLKKLKHYNALALPAQSHSHEKFNSGFRQCASEVSRFMKSEPGIDAHVCSRLLGHLGNCMTELEKFVPVQTSTLHHVPSASTASAPVTVNVQSKMYTPPASPDHMHQLSPSSNKSTPVSGSVKTSSSFVPFQPSQPQTIQPNVVPASIVKQEHSFRVVTASSSQQSHITPPSPPLSVGSPSPPHHLNRSSSSEFTGPSPKPSLFSPPLRTPKHHQPEVTDGQIWRPW